MSAASLEAAFDAHKVPILAAVGGGVALLAFMRRKSAAASSADPAAVTSYATGGQLAGTTGSGGYDSTSTDLYSAISPQMASLEAQIAALANSQDQKKTPTPVPKPTPAPTPHPAPKPAPPKPPVDHKYVPTDPKTFHPVVKPAPKHKTDTWVTVAKGQTLSGIAAKYGASITPSTIARGNGIANPNRIYAGQRLHIVG